MRITKHYNSNFPERETYKCTIRYTTKFGTLDEVTKWRDDQMEKHDYYRLIEESNTKAAGEFYKRLEHKGD